MPVISSRTPEGDPLRCPLCGEVCVEASLAAGDVPCPTCGQLLWLFRHGENTVLLEGRRVPDSVRKVLDFLRVQIGWDPARSPNRPFQSFEKVTGLDSLDSVELAMEIEEEFDINIPDEIAQGIHSFEDLILYLLERDGNEQD